MELEDKEADVGVLMLKWLLSSFCLILILSLNAHAQGQNAIALPDDSEAAPSKIDAEWRASLRGFSDHDEQSQHNVVETRLDFKALYHLNPSLFLDFQPSFRFLSGATQSVDGADKADNKLLLSQAAVHYSPMDVATLSAGALYQRTLHTQILIDRLSFPAARIESALKAGSFESAIALEEAVPTSASFSTNTQQLEGTPTMTTAALRFQWKSYKDFYWQNSIGYVTYQNLPSVVAQQSSMLGNTVDSMSETQYKFRYDYQAIEAQSELKIPAMSFLNLIAHGEYLQNQKAPSDMGSAYLASGGTEILFSKAFTMSMTLGYFSLAPDSSISYFNATNFETNRIGYFAETVFTFPKEKFNIRVQYRDADVMYTSPTQSRDKMMFIQLETFYAKI
jgi:hypothetical protein